MEIKFDYYLKQDGMNRIMHTSLNEDDIVEMLEKKFREGDLPCPAHFNREKVEIEFSIDQVII